MDTHAKLRCTSNLLAMLAVLLAAGGVPRAVYAQGRPDVVWARGGHAFGISAVAYSPDGSVVATGGTADATVKFFGVADGMLIRTIRAFTWSVESIAWLPDGATIVALGKEWSGASSTDPSDHVRTFRVADGAVLDDFVPSGGVASWGTASMALSPDGQLVAVWTGTTGPRVIRLADHAQLADLGVSLSPAASGFAFSEDGRSAALDNGAIHLFATSDWHEVRVFGDHLFGTPVFNAAGNRILTCAGAPVGLQVFNVNDGSLRDSAQTYVYDCLGLVWSANEEYVAYPSGRSTVDVRRTADWSLLRTFAPDSSSDYGIRVAFSRDSAELLTASHDIRTWNVADGTLARQLNLLNGPVSALAVSHGGSVVAVGTDYNVTGDPQNFIALTWGSNGQLIRQIDNGTAVLGLAFSTDDSTLVASSADGTVKFWRVKDGALIRSVFLGSPSVYSPVELFPDGQSVAVLNGYQHVYVLSMSTGAITRTLSVPPPDPHDPTSGNGLALGISSDGLSVVVGGVGATPTPHGMVWFFVPGRDSFSTSRGDSSRSLCDEALARRHRPGLGRGALRRRGRWQRRSLPLCRGRVPTGRLCASPSLTVHP